MSKKILLAVLTILALLLTASASVAEETASVQVGDHFTYGVYEQDNDLGNGKEPIEWRVLKIEGNEALCITEYGLDSVCYSTARGHARWRTATLRDWLSNDFYNAAFTEEEKAAIVTKEITNWREKPTDGDPVILLSTDEAKRLFSSHEDRMCTPTAYCVAQGAYTSVKFQKAADGPANCHWWLRTHSWESNSKGTYVAASGGVMTCGGHTDGIKNNNRIAVRPCIYLSLDAITK